MNSDWPQLAWQILHALFTLALAIYAYSADRHRAHRDQLEELRTAHDARIRQLETDSSGVKARLESMPSAQAISDMNATLAGLSAQVEGARESMRAIALRFDRVEDYLDRITRRP